MTSEITDEIVGYISRYGGRCRDCADEDGVCPMSGLPCGGSQKAIRWVLGAYVYGVKHGFISPLAARPIEAGSVVDDLRAYARVGAGSKHHCQVQEDAADLI